MKNSVNLMITVFSDKRSLSELEIYQSVVDNIPMNELPEGTYLSVARKKRQESEDDKYIIKWCCSNFAACKELRCPFEYPDKDD